MEINSPRAKWLYFSSSLCLVWSAAAAAKSLQSCLTLCDPIDGSPPGSPVPGAVNFHGERQKNKYVNKLVTDFKVQERKHRKLRKQPEIVL